MSAATPLEHVTNTASNHANSGAMAVAQVPGMIDQGYAAIAVIFDVWGIAGMVSSAMASARKAIEEKVDGKDGEANGSK